MIVRRSIITDEPDLVRMGQSFWSETPLSAYSVFNPECLIDFIRAASMTETASIWVAEDGGKVIGAVGGIVYPLFFSGDLVAQELFWWVDPDSRMSEASKLLYNELEAWAKDRGAVALSMIAIENGKAERVGNIYKRKGFIPTEHAYVRGL